MRTDYDRKFILNSVVNLVFNKKIIISGFIPQFPTLQKMKNGRTKVSKKFYSTAKQTYDISSHVVT